MIAISSGVEGIDLGRSWRGDGKVWRDRTVLKLWESGDMLAILLLLLHLMLLLLLLLLLEEGHALLLVLEHLVLLLVLVLLRHWWVMPLVVRVVHLGSRY